MLALSNNDTTGRWPVKMPYPLPGALLLLESSRFTEIYIPQEWDLEKFRAEMIKKLQGEVAKWRAADSTTTIPALHILPVAQDHRKRQYPHAHAVQTNRHSS
jgi:hypothetical protein